MSFIRQLVTGLLTALVSGVIVLGALSLASAEGSLQFTATPTVTHTPGLPQPGQATETAQPSATPVPPTACPPPQGWVAYEVQAGDTLETLAALHGITAEQVIQANCLLSGTLMPGSNLYLPPLPTATPTPTLPPNQTPTEAPSATPRPTIRPCGPPSGWVTYIVQPGDTLYSLSRIFGVSVAELQFANCLANPNDIKAGSTLYVPFIPARSATPTRTTAAPSNTPKAPTSTPRPATATPTASFTAAPPSATPSFTPSDTPAPTDTPTFTPQPTDTHTPTPTETPTLPPP